MPARLPAAPQTNFCAQYATPLCHVHVFEATAVVRWDKRNGKNSAGRECFPLLACCEQRYMALSPAALAMTARMLVVLATAT